MESSRLNKCRKQVRVGGLKMRKQKLTEKWLMAQRKMGKTCIQTNKKKKKAINPKTANNKNNHKDR